MSEQNRIFQCTNAFVTLASVKIESLVDFYTQLLGQAPTSYIPNIYAEFQLSGLRLGIFKPKEILTASHGKETYAYDPDGNRLILHQSW